MVEMYFMLDADITILSPGLKNDFVFKPHEQNILFLDQIRGHLICNKGSFHVLEVDMNPEFFKKYLPGAEMRYAHFIRQMDLGVSDRIRRENGLIDLEMHGIISDIIECERKGLYKRMFLESKIIELLLLQLEQFDDSEDSALSIKSDDIEKIYIVRDFILDHLGESHSLMELARLAGTNEFTFKERIQGGVWHNCVRILGRREDGEGTESCSAVLIFPSRRWQSP